MRRMRMRSRKAHHSIILQQNQVIVREPNNKNYYITVLEIVHPFFPLRSGSPNIVNSKKKKKKKKKIRKKAKLKWITIIISEGLKDREG